MYQLHVHCTRVAGATLFGWSLSRFFGPAPRSYSYSTVNILFLRDPKYEYISMTMSMSISMTMTINHYD